jgi:hypothetical protein
MADDCAVTRLGPADLRDAAVGYLSTRSISVFKAAMEGLSSS